MYAIVPIASIDICASLRETVREPPLLKTCFAWTPPPPLLSGTEMLVDALLRLAARTSVSGPDLHTPTSTRFVLVPVKLAVVLKRKGVICGSALARVVVASRISSGLGSIHGTMPRALVGERKWRGCIALHTIRAVIN